MNKTVIWTLIIYTLILLIVGYFYFNSDSNYKNKINKIEEKYKQKYDSLNNDINTYKIKIDELDSLNDNYTNDIDSIKNKQNDNETAHYTPFHSLSPDSIANIFAKYDISKRYK